MKYIWDVNNTNTYNNRVGHYKFNQQFEFVKKYTSNTHSCLDIAGGSGRFAIPLNKNIPQITVIDINNEALSILKSRNAKIETICNDFLATPNNKKYSLILCIEAIFYFKDQPSFFSKIKSLLNKDGYFVFSFTNTKSWRYALRKYRHRKRATLDYKEYSLENLRKILENANFEIAEIKGYNWIPLPLTSNSKLVSFFAWIENKLCLNKWISQSPWLMIAVKIKNN